MKYQTALNNRYAELCKKLGDLVVKQKQIADSIENLESEISMLNQAAPVLQQIENEILADILNQKPKANKELK